MSGLRRHLPFALVLAAFALLALRFAPQDGLATIGDDSVGYLTLARALEGGPAAAHVREWVGTQAHFPPLFPGMLALGGGADDFRVAYIVVTVFAILSLALVYGYAARELGSETSGLWVAIIFVLLPTAWISLKGILSESLYLFLSLAALAFHQERERSEKVRPGESWLMGALLGAVCLTRLVGVTLVLAYAATLLAQGVRHRRLPTARDLAAFVPPLAMIAAWLALRPIAGPDAYQAPLAGVAALWIDEPVAMAIGSAKALFGGWIASFNVDGEGPLGAKLAFGALAALALAGTALRIRANRLDGWYVALYLALIFVWTFPNEYRRFFYPVLPFLILHAGHALLAACARLDRERYRAVAVAGTAALAVVLAAPALALFAQKALDRAPVVPGSEYSNADIREYFEIVNVDRARARARREIDVLAGLEAIDDVTPRNARIMWMRPEYIAVLGDREAVPYYFSWDATRLMQAIRDSGADYFVFARVFKADLAHRMGEPSGQMHVVRRVADPVFSLGDDFALFRIDRARLERELEK